MDFRFWFDQLGSYFGPIYWPFALAVFLQWCAVRFVAKLRRRVAGPWRVREFLDAYVLVTIAVTMLLDLGAFYYCYRYWGLPSSFKKGEIGILVGEVPGDKYQEEESAYAREIYRQAANASELKGEVRVETMHRPLPAGPARQQEKALQIGRWEHATFVVRPNVVAGVQEPWITIIGQPQFSGSEAPLGKFPNTKLPDLDEMPLPHNVLLLARCVLGLSLYHARHYPEASVQLRGVLDSPKLPSAAPPRPYLYLMLGRALAELGRYEEARQALGQALCLRPQYAGAHCTLGYVLDMVGLYGEARNEYVRAIGIKPDYEQARHDLGANLEFMGRYKMAEAEFRKAIALRPDDPLPHSGLCTTFDREGRYVLAIAECQKAIALRPDFAAAYNELGLALFDEKQYNDAISEFRKVLALGVKDARAYDNLGVALRGSGQTDEAISQFRKAIALEPDFAHAYNNLASALTEKGHYDDAIKAYRRAISLEPDDAYPRFGLANAFEKAGREREAEEEYRYLLQHHYRMSPE